MPRKRKVKAAPNVPEWMVIIARLLNEQGLAQKPTTRDLRVGRTMYTTTIIITQGAVTIQVSKPDAMFVMGIKGLQKLKGQSRYKDGVWFIVHATLNGEHLECGDGVEVAAIR